MQRTKKIKKIENWIRAGGGASGERPRPAAARAASPTGPAAPPAPAPPPARRSRRAASRRRPLSQAAWSRRKGGWGAME